MVTKESLLELIKENLPFGADVPGEVREDSLLAELGLDSMRLLNMLLVLQDRYSMDIERMTENGMPSTIADLVTLVERGVSNVESSSDG